MTDNKEQDVPEIPTEEVVTEATETAASGETPEAVSTDVDHEAKAAEYLDDLKRVQADFENYKKRVKNDERELYGHLSAQIASDLFPVLDNLHAAVGHVPAEAASSPWVTGITYIEKQFEDVLANYGVVPMTVNPGDAFDPTRHEALDHQAAEGTEATPLKIEKVVQKGYQIKDKIVRPAKVIVS